MWWAQIHSLPLPVSGPFQIKGKHTAVGAEEPGKETQAVNQAPVTSTSEVSEYLQPKLSRLFGAQLWRVLHADAAFLQFPDKSLSFTPILFEAISLLP